MRRAAALLLPFVAGCGLLDREPELPSLERVHQARAAEAGDWELLVQAWRIRSESAGAAAGELQRLSANSPGSLRLAALVQDFAVLDSAGPEALGQLRLEAERQALVAPEAGRLYLAARIAERERALELVAMALELDPDLVPARVLQIGLQARAGDRRPLEELATLLEDHPGSAEGWRLLGQLAPFYARPELAVRAAQTEPWLSFGDPRLARLYQAEAALAAGEAELALQSLRGLEDRRARLLRAAALAERGDPEAAWTVLQDLARQWPDDPVVHFDLALLALDHLDRPEQVRAHLERVLELAAGGAELPLQRLTQAEVWLEGLGGRREPGP
ncbi:MAG: tetratricopeptide repeat protein [Planctomycetes bacterium]|nr:tetratricopeptide repeat protein [Planctomycetota bacterium]